jgi:ribosome biogenesis GTPase
VKKGLVIKSTGSWYHVLQEDGTELTCKIRGKLRMDDIKSTNPVAVGDIVILDDDNVIVDIEQRKNYIIRKASNLSKQSHIIAANVDQAVLIATVNYPVTTTVFIDRFLAAAEAYRIPVSIIFNKTDRYNEDEMVQLEELKKIYKNIGYPVYNVSVKKDENFDEIKNIFKDKITVVAGHSGVGKSTLINRLEPGIKLKTAEISDSHLTGKHTTTFAEMHKLSFGGYIIDTPGIRGFGLYHIEKNELYHFFRELFKYSKKCRYNNCLHVNEPGCAVKEAVEKGEIALSRYNSYLNIYFDDNTKYR